MTATRSRSASAVSGALLVALSTLLLFPLYAIVEKAFAPDGGWGFETARTVLSEPGLRSSITNTVIIALAAGALSTVIGLFLAVASTIIPSGRRMRRFLELIPLVPLTVPALVGALGWLFLLAPTSGWLNVAFRAVTGSSADEGPISVFSLPVAVWVTSLYVVPFVFTVMDASLRRVNSEALEAMLLSGCRPAGMLLRMTTGILRPALLAAVTLALVQSISLFSVPLILQVDVLTTYIFRSANSLGLPERAAIASLPLMALAFSLSATQIWLMRRSDRYVTVTGKGSSGKTVSLGRTADAIFKGMAVVYFVVTAILPLGAIAVVSLLPFWKPRFALSDLSFTQYEVLRENVQVQEGIRNSLVLGIACAAGAVVISVLVVVFASRLRDRISQAAFAVANVPLGIPVVVLGLGFLIAFIGPPIVLYGTLSLLVVAYLVAFLPLAIRNIGPVVQQIGSELEEAAMVHGSTFGGATARVTLPLAVPGIASSFVLLFIIIFREFPIASFVSTPGTNVVAVSLLNFHETGRWPAAAVLSIAICAASFAAIALGRFLTNRVQLRHGQVDPSSQLSTPRQTLVP